MPDTTQLDLLLETLKANPWFTFIFSVGAVCAIGWIFTIFGFTSLLNPYVAICRVVHRPMLILSLFFRYLLEIEKDNVVPDQYRIGDPSRKSSDMQRMMHFAWHCVVFLPVIVVCLVALVMKADWREVLFFFCLACSTVSLEICIGIIIQKVAYLESLSKQTTRAYLTIKDTVELAGWVKYFQRRHTIGKSGVAKAALVTTLSLVLFSSIVGIETQRLQSHSSVSSVDLVKFLENHQGTPPEELAKLIETNYHSHGKGEEHRLLSMALVFATLLIGIAVTKLWIQTRSCLEHIDPMDRFSSSAQALNSLKRHYVTHLAHHESDDQSDTELFA